MRVTQCLYKDSVPLSGTVTLNLIVPALVHITTHFFALTGIPFAQNIPPCSSAALPVHESYPLFLANHNCRGVQIPGDNLRHNHASTTRRPSNPCTRPSPSTTTSRRNPFCRYRTDGRRFRRGTHELIELFIRLAFDTGADFGPRY